MKRISEVSRKGKIDDAFIPKLSINFNHSANIYSVPNVCQPVLSDVSCTASLKSLLL